MSEFNLKEEFYATSDEILLKIEEDLLKLEDSDEALKKELINDIFRYFHTLKGNARTAGFKVITEITHKVETLLDKLRKDEIELTSQLVDTILYVKDLLSDMISNREEYNDKIEEIENKIKKLTGEKRGENSYIFTVVAYLKKLHNILYDINREKDVLKYITNLYFEVLNFKKYLKSIKKNISLIVILEDFIFLVKTHKIVDFERVYNILNHTLNEIFNEFESIIFKEYEIKKVECSSEQFSYIHPSGKSNVIIYIIDSPFDLNQKFLNHLLELENNREKIIIEVKDVYFLSRIRYFLDFYNINKIIITSNYKSIILNYI